MWFKQEVKFKMSKECPKLPVTYNMSNVKKSNHSTMYGVHKNKFDINRLKHNRSILRSHLKVHQITQKHFMNIFRCFDDHQIKVQN